MYYIRKFENNLWHQYDYGNTKKISSDAITISLKTTSKTLSFWQITDLSLINKEGLLAILGSMDSIDKIDVMIFERQELEDAGFTLQDSPGKTSITSLKHLHTNIVEIDLSLLSDFAHIFANKLHEEETKKKALKEEQSKAKQKGKDCSTYDTQIENLLVRRYTLPTIKTIMNTAIDNGTFDISELGERTTKKLGRA